ncbi:hypothetical protein ACN47E_004434 [Coniothyrium glycines]
MTHTAQESTLSATNSGTDAGTEEHINDVKQTIAFFKGWSKASQNTEHVKTVKWLPADAFTTSEVDKVL